MIQKALREALLRRSDPPRRSATAAMLEPSSHAGVWCFRAGFLPRIGNLLVPGYNSLWCSLSRR